MSDKITVQRRYTRAGYGPFHGIEFVKRRAVIYNADGSVNFEMDDIDAPAAWDQVAIDVLASKYFRKRGVPQLDDDGDPIIDPVNGAPVLGAENSAKRWALRLADAWRTWGERGGYFASREDAEAFRDEMAYMLITQMGSPNSPQHFNTGLFESYGIVGDPEGNWYYDEDDGDVKLSKHRYERSAVSACYIQSVQDKLVGEGSIFDLWEREARLFKAGSGTGSNFSALRGKGEPLSGGGVSSGVMSWLKIGDAGAGSVASGGTTRRAAKMVILNVDHPQIVEFVNSKVEEERKAAALIAGGFSAEWNAEGGAYESINFQNGNHSVRLTEGFLQAVADDTDWNLTGRVDGKVLKTLKARDLWDQIAQAAWRSADPGVQFDDLINDWNTAASDGWLNGTNPCSEYTHLDDTACNLASLRLTKFYNDESGEFDVDSYRHAARLFTIMLEISVSMAHYPSAKLAKNSFEHRTLGLGYADMGSLLMRAGLPYDSAEGRAVIGALSAIMHAQAYATSAELAAAVGPAAAYGRNVEHMERVIRNHARAAYGSRINESELGAFELLHVKPMVIDHSVLKRTLFAPLSDAVIAAADNMLAGAALGRRNMQVTVIAPTGTIGLQMSVGTTGIEPDYALVKGKKLAGGGFMKISNESVAPALRRLGYAERQINDILTHALGTATLNGQTAVRRETLIAKGFTEDMVDRVESGLARAMDLRSAFAQHTVGVDSLLALGIPAERLNGGFDLLEWLGFSADEINSSSVEICGHQTVEGAPGLNPADLPVFDTAGYCGDGTRVIRWEGHVKALGAVAPHLSGSCSKTINLPNNASVDDVRACFELAYAIGVKATAIYRDGSKASQVLAASTTHSNKELKEAAEIPRTVDTMAPGTSPTAFYHGSAPPRFRLPNLRFGPTFKFNVGGTELFLHVGEYPDGSVGEIFLDLLKEGSALKGAVSTWAIAVSHGLQYGVPLEKFVSAFTYHSFPPSGVVAGDPNLKMATSIADAVFKLLGYHYLGDTSLVQVTNPGPQRLIGTAADGTAWSANVVNSPQRPLGEPVSAESADGFVAPAVVPTAPVTFGHKWGSATGEICSSCGGQLIRAGTCSYCSSCGDTTGCS